MDMKTMVHLIVSENAWRDRLSRKNSLIVYYLITVALVAVLGFILASKLIEHEKFIFQMELSPMPLMKDYAEYISWAVPASCLLILSLLFVNHVTRWWGVLASLVLFGTFSIYIVYMLLSPYSLPCTCAGLANGISWAWQLVINIILMLLAYCGLKLHRHIPNTETS